MAAKRKAAPEKKSTGKKKPLPAAFLAQMGKGKKTGTKKAPPPWLANLKKK